MRSIFYALLILCFPRGSWAQVLAPSAEEVYFSYSATFVSDRSVDENSVILAQSHASHMFGIFHSPKVIRGFGLNPDTVGGIASPRASSQIQIISARMISRTRMQVHYTNRGRMLMHKKVSAAALKAGSIHLPMPNDLQAIYDVRCTDPDYQSFGDFWYFYDPFRKGCEHLAQAPLASDVILRITRTQQVKKEVSPRLDLLRGNNGNGDLFSISIVHGYSEGADVRWDDGRVNFDQMNEYFRAQKFAEETKFSGTSKPLHIFTKSLKLSTGKVIQVQIQNLLIETQIASRNVGFAKFFKQAVAQDDVIVYSGHSGLGGNLDIPSLESKAGKFVFPLNKRQIFFFDSCSSYAYYLDTFAAEKTKTSIDVLSYGLSSLFNTGPQILKAFLMVLLSPTLNDATWVDIMTYMEKPLRGGSYLLNVGGI